MEIPVRRAEPDDHEALHRIFSGPKAVEGSPQLPLPLAETWRKRLLETPEGLYALVACVDDEVVGSLNLGVSENPRASHAGHTGVAVRDDWQGRGVGTAPVRAAPDLADNRLNLTRVDMYVYADNEAGI